MRETQSEKYRRFISKLSPTTTDGMSAEDIAEFIDVIEKAYELRIAATKAALILVGQPIPCFYVDSSHCKKCDKFFCAYNLGRKLEQAILNGKENENEN